MTFREAEEYLLSPRAVRDALRARPDAQADDGARPAAAPVRVDPRGRDQRQVLDGAVLRRDPRAPRAAHRQLHLAAPELLPRADRGGGGAGAARPTSPLRWSVSRTPPSSSTAPRTPDDRVTQFEALTAAAYHELARRGVEVAVIEAGLGGRYDATNVIPSKVQALTSRRPRAHALARPHGRRHRRGEARRCARPRRRSCVGPLDPASAAVAERVAAERHARLVRAPADAGRAAARPRRLPAAELRAGAGRGRGLRRTRRAALRLGRGGRRRDARSRAASRSSARPR